MTKTNRIRAGIEVTSQSDDRPSIHAITLTIGAWKELFPGDQNNIIIADALNYCTCNDGLTIAGYLITNRRVFLVLEISSAYIESMLVLFYERVRKEIKKKQNVIKGQSWRYESEGQTKTDELFVNLFKQYPLVNDHLIRLITGRSVNLLYYSPHLARLKDRIHNYNFCSALDYSGAKGPVIVKLLDSEGNFQ
jgi:hypothetical protein